MLNICMYKAYQTPEVNLEKTGTHLKQLRTKNNLKVRDLQAFFGFENPNAIYQWERGLKLPCLSNMLALAALYEVPLESILICDNSNGMLFHFHKLLYSERVKRLSSKTFFMKDLLW